MARVVEDHLPPAMQVHFSSEVIVPDGHEEDCKVITITTASHPVPDARSLAAAGRILTRPGLNINRPHACACLWRWFQPVLSSA